MLLEALPSTTVKVLITLSWTGTHTHARARYGKVKPYSTSMDKAFVDGVMDFPDGKGP